MSLMVCIIALPSIVLAQGVPGMAPRAHSNSMSNQLFHTANVAEPIAMHQSQAMPVKSNGVAIMDPCEPVRCVSNINTSPWHPVGDIESIYNDMGMVCAIAVDLQNLDNIYVGTMTGGAFKTTDGGSTWNNITDVLNLPSPSVTAIAIDPSNSDHILISTSNTQFYGANLHQNRNNGVYESHDAGLHWSATSIGCESTTKPFSCIKFCASNPTIVLACGNTDIFKSTDGGANFHRVFQYSGVNPDAYVMNDIEFKISDNSKVIVCGANNGVSGNYQENQLLCSSDFGSTWVNRTPAINTATGNTKSPFLAVSVTASDPSQFFALTRVSNDTRLALLKSSNNGTSWTQIASCPHNGSSMGTMNAVAQWGEWTNGFAVGIAPNNIYYGAVRFYRSTNSGNAVSYTTEYFPGEFGNGGQNSSHAFIRSMVSVPNGANDIIFAATDGGIIKSVNSGVSFTNINGTGLTIGENIGLATFQTVDKLAIGRLRNGIRVNTNGNNVFDQTFRGHGGDCDVDPSNDNIIYATSNGMVLKSTNQGTTWGSPIGFSDPQFFPRIQFLAGTSTLLVGQSTHLYKIGPNNVVTQLNDPVYSNPNAQKRISAIGTSKAFPSVIYQAKGALNWGNPNPDVLFKSLDGGSTWINITSNLPHVFDWRVPSAIVVDDYNVNNLFIALDGAGGMAGNNRVWHSMDGGLTWVDVSSGLPALGVNCMVFQEGTANGVYLGNAVGVYKFHMTDQWNGYWECFSEGLPMSQVTDLEVSPCGGKLFCSTYGRGTFATDLAPSSDISINYDQTWEANVPRHFSNNVFVNGNVLLKIKGTVTFTEGTSLFIAPGAKVVVDGGTLTNACGEMWHGIQVLGIKLLPQSITISPTGNVVLGNHGWLTLSNGAMVSNAEVAVSNYLNYDGFVDDDFYGGGKVTATNAQFINNERCVDLRSYPFGLQTSFKRCNFETNSILNNSLAPMEMVTLNDNKGTIFSGCTFKYSAGGSYAPQDHGVGIISANASFIVNGYCPTFQCSSPTRTTFTDLSTGIMASATNPLRTVDISQCDFVNNYIDGAYLNGLKQPGFRNCNVIVGDDPWASGLYLDQCYDYAVRNSSFTSNSGGKTGIFVNESPYGFHEIYRNSFSNLTQAVATIGNNGHYNSGLTIKCNDFAVASANDFDVKMYPNLSGNMSVNSTQGTASADPKTLAGNKYGATCSADNQWSIQGTLSFGPINHWSNVGFPFTPTCANPQVVLNTSTTTYSSAQCPDKDNSAALTQSSGSLPNLSQHHHSLRMASNTNPRQGDERAGDAIRQFLLDSLNQLEDKDLIGKLKNIGGEDWYVQHFGSMHTTSIEASVLHADFHEPRLLPSQEGSSVKSAGAQPEAVNQEVPALHLSPNPSKDAVWITLYLPDSQYAALEVRNSFGQVVFQGQLASSQGYRFDIEHLPSGIYFVTASDLQGKQLLTKKLVIEN